MQGKIETRVGIFVLAALAVLIYMGFQVGAFRFDRTNYNIYTLCFNDISGLVRKAEVKIAGVKVGWVESVSLIAHEQVKAQAEVMVLKQYSLYQDAYAIVRQEGFLGPKYIEIIPGDPLLSHLSSGSILGKPSTEPVSVDEIMHQFKEIASNVTDVTASFKNAIGGVEGQEQLKAVFDNLQMTVQKLSRFATVIDRTVERNENNIDSLLSVGVDVKRLAEKLEHEVFPSFQASVEKISSVFDRDFSRVISQLESTAQALEEASLQARDGLKSVTSVAEKIDEGKGLIGKLVNEDETYHDLKTAVCGIKNYLGKLDRMQIIFDAHSETMIRPAENYRYEDSKGYFQVRVHPSEDYFYLLEIASSQRGYRYETDTEAAYFNAQGNPVTCGTVSVDNPFLLPFVRTEKNKFKRNKLLVGLQFGKVFNNMALRCGLFENSAGLAVDVEIPFRTDKFRWVTTLEVFDLAGWNRLDDRRPHAKWLNRMFFMRNLYFVFGADDFASKRNASVFFGAGLRFGDDDVKYILSGVSGGAGYGLAACG